MMIPLNYVAGRRCETLFEAWNALYSKYPGTAMLELCLALFFILLNIFLIYVIFIRKNE